MRNIIKVYVLWSINMLVANISLSSLGCCVLKENCFCWNVVFLKHLEMLLLFFWGGLAWHGDGFSIKRDFYQFWLRSQRRMERWKGRKERHKSSSWVYRAWILPCCLFPFYSWLGFFQSKRGQWTCCFSLFSLRWFRLDKF